jgi:hypothetical protein
MDEGGSSGPVGLAWSAFEESSVEAANAAAP